MPETIAIIKTAITFFIIAIVPIIVLVLCAISDLPKRKKVLWVLANLFLVPISSYIYLIIYAKTKLRKFLSALTLITIIGVGGYLFYSISSGQYTKAMFEQVSQQKHKRAIENIESTIVLLEKPSGGSSPTLNKLISDDLSVYLEEVKISAPSENNNLINNYFKVVMAVYDIISVSNKGSEEEKIKQWNETFSNRHGVIPEPPAQ